MKAAQINEYGDASVIQVVDISPPIPTSDQVLVEVHAASLNPYDTTVRSGGVQDSIPLELPVTLGGDLAGIVTAVGDNVSTLQVGIRIYGQANVVAGNSGAFAEFAATSAGQLAVAPANLSDTEAAAMPLTGVSALQALTTHINLKPGQKLFIHGGAGGIGSAAIQIAKHIGAYVAVTATGDGVPYAESLGADEVIDYQTESFVERLSDFDAAFDTVGGDEFAKTFGILKRGGVAVSMIAPVDQAAADEYGITALTQGTQVTTQVLDELTTLIEQDILRPHIDATYPLERIADAMRHREAGGVRGKIVLEIQ